MKTKNFKNRKIVDMNFGQEEKYKKYESNKEEFTTTTTSLKHQNNRYD